MSAGKRGIGHAGETLMLGRAPHQVHHQPTALGQELYDPQPWLGQGDSWCYRSDLLPTAVAASGVSLRRGGVVEFHYCGWSTIEPTPAKRALGPTVIATNPTRAREGMAVLQVSEPAS